LNNGDGATPGDYHLNIESSPGGVTTHSRHLKVAPGMPLWWCMRCDFDWRPGMTQGTTAADGGRGELALFHPYTGQLLGYAVTPLLKVTTTADTCDGVSACRLGNSEVGTDSGTSTYFKHVGFDYKGRFPIRPRPMFQAPSMAAWTGVISAGGGGGGLTPVYGGWQGGICVVTV
jgi:hypothetical protein